MWTKVILANSDDSQRLMGWVELSVTEGTILNVVGQPGTWTVFRAQRTSDTSPTNSVIYSATVVS